MNSNDAIGLAMLGTAVGGTAFGIIVTNVLHVSLLFAALDGALSALMLGLAAGYSARRAP